jgi:hypothetical protein
MKSATSFLVMVVLVSAIVFCLLSSSIVIVRAATANPTKGDHTRSMISTIIPISTTSHSKNNKPTHIIMLLQVKTYFNKAIQALSQHSDKQTVLLYLKAANSKLTSAYTASGSSTHNNARSTDISSIQSIKMSVMNAITALQSHNNMISLQGLLYFKSANSKLSSVLSMYSPTVVTSTINS